MAIPFDLTKIDERLNTFATKEKKINHLNKHLFASRKALAEFELHDLAALKRLTKKTKADYEIYQNEFDNGGLIYLHPATNEATAKRLGFQDIELLEKRIRLEYEYAELKTLITIFENKIKEVETELEFKANPANDLIRNLRIEQAKRQELSEENREKQKQLDYDVFIKPYTEIWYSLELFDRHLRVDKAALPNAEYLLKLKELDKQYRNVFLYHTIHGDFHQYEVSEKIVNLLSNEIESSLNSNNSGTTPTGFKLSTKRGVRIDLIRILNAMYELKMIKDNNDQIPTKELFMKQSGEFFGNDFSNYDTDLSQAMNNSSVEANLKIFDELKSITQSKVLDKKSR